MLQSHSYPVHTQDQVPKHPLSSCLTIHAHPHLVHPKTNSDNDTWTAHSQLAYRSFMQFNTQGDTKLRQVKIQFGYLHFPPLNPDPVAAKARRGLGQVAWSWGKQQWLASKWGRGKVSLLHNLNDILVLQRMVFTHFLRIVFHRETPDQSTVWKRKKNSKYK